MEAIVIFAILNLANTKLTLGSFCPEEKCEFDIKVYDQKSAYNMHGRPSTDNVASLVIKNDNNSGCYINLTEIIERFNFTAAPVIAYVSLICKQSIPVHVIPVNQKYNILAGKLNSTKCTLSYESIDHLSMAMDMYIISLSHSQLSEPCNGVPSECLGLRETGQFAYYNNQYPPQNLTELFSCTDVFPRMASAYFVNMSWSELPSFIQVRFINLQSLWIPSNNFTVPPYFPWQETEQNLQINLSRSIPFQTVYYLNGYDIPANIYERIFNLDYNRISDLRNFSFQGRLHGLSIRENHLSHVGANTFRNIRGLQHLNLDQNKVDHIPMGIFDGLIMLRYLSLQQNNIKTLDTGIFRDLESLICLGLGFNYISMLQEGLFNSLNNLEILRLEFNNISVIKTAAFPAGRIALQLVNLSNNPLLFMPEFIFKIQSLYHIALQSTLVSFRNCGDFLDSIDYTKLVETVSGPPNWLWKGLRVIDLTNARVDSLCLQNMTLERKQKLVLIIQHYHVELGKNPLSCSCNILSFQRFINDLLKSKIIKGNEYYFTEWKCESPVQLQGRRMLSVSPEEIYYPAKVLGCPEDCSCYKRCTNINVIVDCRYRNLSDLHDVMPQGNLELWYGGNKINILNHMHYLGFVKMLDLSDNSISKLETHAIKNLNHVQKLYLHSNLLAYLPENIAHLEFETLTLKQNPFKCDCRTLWMKDWMIKRNNTIVDWSDTKCNDRNEEGRQFLLVPDDEFVCKEDFNFLRHVIVPTVTSIVILLTVISILVIVYAYRMECKVLMYIYFGVHPFDKDTENKDEETDAVIVHSEKLTGWVMKNIVDILEGLNNNFQVCDMARDFVVGFTFQQNLNQVVRHSKRMILIISEDWNTDDKTFNVAWNIAQEKIKESKSNFGIIISHGVTSEQIKDKALLRFIRRGRYIDSKNKLFLEKILYSMPIKDANRHERKLNVRSLIQRELSIHEEEVDNNRIHAFVSYSDDDQEFVTRELAPELEIRGYRLWLPDRDFIPGATKEENILKAISDSLRTVFVLSGSLVKDEWSLFTFITACEKSLREKTNYLIVILRDDRDLYNMVEEVKHYLKTYVSLHVKDRWFWPKLLSGLPPNGRNRFGR